ncbi:MAG: YkgJ family cysteine cluster protein [Deltaproteobacteria bacterium]|nr:YkgJ family cysteine cluster protein [Deltaproteobacteria bacterium]
MSEEDDQAFGTAAPSAPITRAEFERAIRSLNMSDVDLRDALLQLAARVITLTDEVTRRLDGVEPQPAPPNTPAAPPVATVEETVGNLVGGALAQIRASDISGGQRVSLDTSGENKYEVENAGPPCAELIHICEARCCKLTFALSTTDLDEGVIRWDYGQPYLIKQRASDAYCVHNHPASHFCTVHEHRPRVCRTYDCSTDTRIWIDFANRIPAPTPEHGTREAEKKGGPAFDLLERARARGVAVHIEMTAISESFGAAEPTRGPAPKKR